MCSSDLGWVRLRPTRLGARSFIGNGAYVPDGTTFPDDFLLGVQSSSPKNAQMRAGQTWMGSPPMLLPARETIETPDPKLTFHPPRSRRCLRALIEAFRIVLPLAFIISAGYVMNGGSRAAVYVNADSYSIRVKTLAGVVVARPAATATELFSRSLRHTQPCNRQPPTPSDAGCATVRVADWPVLFDRAPRRPASW